LNNGAVAASQAGDVQLARKYYGKIQKPKSPAELVLYRATGGLLEFRAGNTFRGRDLYESALQAAIAAGLKTDAFKVYGHLVDEESRAGQLTQSDAELFVDTGDEFAKSNPSLSRLVLDVWRRQSAAIRLRTPATQNASSYRQLELFSQLEGKKRAALIAPHTRK
jgi:hypothetical protein